MPPYLRAVDALSASLMRHNAAVIELGSDDAALLRCALESARLYFRTRKGGRRDYTYRAGRYPLNKGKVQLWEGSRKLTSSCEVEKGLLMLISSDTPGLQVCTPMGVGTKQMAACPLGTFCCLQGRLSAMPLQDFDLLLPIGPILIIF